MFASLIDLHSEIDIALWVLFLLGQCLWILRRAGIAVRSTTHPVKSRRQYLWMNWDTILIRTVLEYPFFWVWRHIPIATLLATVHITAGGNAVMTTILMDVQDSAPFFVFLGFFSDAGLDAISTWQRIPATWRAFIQERIPQLPTNGQ